MGRDSHDFQTRITARISRTMETTAGHSFRIALFVILSLLSDSTLNTGRLQPAGDTDLQERPPRGAQRTKHIHKSLWLMHLEGRKKLSVAQKHD